MAGFAGAVPALASADARFAPAFSPGIGPNPGGDSVGGFRKLVGEIGVAARPIDAAVGGSIFGGSIATGFGDTGFDTTVGGSIFGASVPALAAIMLDGGWVGS